MIHLHDWYYYDYKKSSYRRCNKCGKKQYRWVLWSESGWEDVYKPQDKIDNELLRKHIKSLLHQIDVLNGRAET